LSARRFSDRGRYQHEFQHEFAVRCPSCDRKAFVFPDALAWRAAHAKLSCTACGHNARVTRRPFRTYLGITKPRLSLPRDPFFQLPLWYVADAKGSAFWAYNAKHLAFLKDYLGATLRIREPHRNGSLASRLPSFLTDRKSRATVVKAIASLEAADLARR
jgi:hypothetical protein